MFFKILGTEVIRPSYYNLDLKVLYKRSIKNSSVKLKNTNDSGK